MRMSYDPNNAAQTQKTEKARAGTYTYRIAEFYETKFRSGNTGIKAVLEVQAFPDRDIKVYDAFVYTETAIWKLQQLFESLRLNFNDPPDTEHVVGMAGKAEFELNDKGYLGVRRYIPAEANNGPDTRMEQKFTPISDNDELPF